MALREIRKEGDPVLREKAREVKKITPQLLVLVEDMLETMRNVQGIGLAAPQVGISKRIIVIEAPDCKEIIKLFNPQILSGDGQESAVEGCLSVPGLQGEVNRPAEVVVRGLNTCGETVEISASGILARALQHEIDHLNGILFIDRATEIVSNKE